MIYYTLPYYRLLELTKKYAPLASSLRRAQLAARQQKILGTMLMDYQQVVIDRKIDGLSPRSSAFKQSPYIQNLLL